jgi:hypothetical protein
MTDFTHSRVSLDLVAASPFVAHYLAVFLAGGHGGPPEKRGADGSLF